ncbi:Ubiquitin-activating enzyme E1-like [Penicillium oxalicum]|uniref:Ubiquitin-activating enzyme E1-like n=1 Tax=Penicillium oxalicum TaxID=69781 RepID=UPI0020B7DC04|nr:Ubiquitin-activating enzyme E1-like [Penicillium oxalicum]KAI2789417.1 Ubiquitin-activating enzyme E1-like [Penicillium oxalicum]
MRASTIKRSLGAELTHKIKESRVLLVGAGGIGCELLKNLVLTGFGEVHIIDLDTIDLSNLNRQFLFRHEHIKKPKALVAKDVAHNFRPDVKLEAYHANIMDSQFSVGWFKSFNIVFNALDNLAARRHVNSMCLAAGVPLIESGTTGFNGQVQVIKGGETECYDCNPKATPKTFAICTIRTTPSQPIHCIVWAKSYLLPHLFGASEEEAAELDTTENSDNAQEIAKLRKEAQTLREVRKAMGTEDFFETVFKMVFEADIERLRAMEDAWKTREAPKVLAFDELLERSNSTVVPDSSADQRPWTVEENFTMFKDSLTRLSKRFKELQDKAAPEDPEPILTFDKDDEDTLDFVAATANLRAEAFHMGSTSKFDTKQMAGNIIPAIATTNAMTASLCVLQSFKVLRNDLSSAKMVFLERSGQRAINSEALRPPNRKCEVCNVARGILSMDANATLEDLVKGVLQLDLGYSEELSIRVGQEIVYEPDMEENISMKLSEFGIKHDTTLTVIDEDDREQDPRVNLECWVTERNGSVEYPKPITLEVQGEIPRMPAQKGSGASVPEIADASKATDSVIASEQDSVETSEFANGLGKRKREAEDEPLTNGHVDKKVASGSSQTANDAVVVVDDDENGAIVIDD